MKMSELLRQLRRIQQDLEYAHRSRIHTTTCYAQRACENQANNVRNLTFTLQKEGVDHNQ